MAWDVCMPTCLSGSLPALAEARLSLIEGRIAVVALIMLGCGYFLCAKASCSEQSGPFFSLHSWCSARFSFLEWRALMTACANGLPVRFTPTIKSRPAPTDRQRQMVVRAKASWSWLSQATTFTLYLARAPVSSTVSPALETPSFRIGSALPLSSKPKHRFLYFDFLGGGVPQSEH
jgi:hypothetical protein